MYTNDRINTINQLYSRQPATIKIRVGKRYIRVILDSRASINVVQDIISQFWNGLMFYILLIILILN
jgi:hypothetical protein